MTFAAPFMLWSLLALVPLVAVYFLKVRPRRRPTTAFFLWEKIFTERQSNRLMHRLRSLWSLLIMAAAFAAIAIALAQPRWSDARRQDLLILIDNSASMQTVESGGTRLELAKAKARDLAHALDGVQRAAVATVADRLRYQSHLTDNPRELLAAIDQIKPSYEASRVEALPRTQPANIDEPATEDAEDSQSDSDSDKEESTAATEPTENDWSDQRRVLLVSDGVLGGGEIPADVELLSVGQEQTNWGIVAADVEFLPGSTDEMSFYYQVASTADEAHEIDLVLSREDSSGQMTIAKVIPLQVEPGVNAPQVLSVVGAQPGRWIAELDFEASDVTDALAADNRACMVARRPPPIAMAVAASDRYFFENSVQAFAGGASALRLVASPQAADVVLAKGATDAPQAIVFQPAGDSPWWSDLGDELEVGAVKLLVPEHPVVRHIDPLAINFLGARRLTPPAGSEVIAEADDGTPLIYVAKRSGEGVVVVNLDPVAAEFYFSAWFPVMVHSAARHLAGRVDALPTTYRPGDSALLPASDGTFAGELQPPSGEATRLDAPRVRQLDKPGFYQIKIDDETQPKFTLACSLLSAGESLLNAQRDAPPPAALASGGPPGGWFIVLALLAVTAESVLYHLRKVG